MIDIDTMPAGREMDVLVAERVFLKKIIKKSFPAINGYMLGGDVYFEDTENHPLIPHYSTDIAVAWKVVEELKPTIFDFSMRNDGFFCKLSRGNNTACVVHAYGGKDFREASAALAICRAALKGAHSQLREATTPTLT